MIVKVSGTAVGATTTPYSAGDLIGNKLTLSGLYPVATADPVMTQVTVQDLSNQKSAMTIVLFESDPANTTFTDNAALDIADADLPKIIGIVGIAPSDYVSFADNAVATVLSLQMATPAVNTLYACILCGGTPTYAANELSLAFGMAR